MHIEAERTADRALAENSRCFLCFMGDRILQKTLWGMHTRGDGPGRLQYDNRNINILVIFTEIVYNKQVLCQYIPEAMQTGEAGLKVRLPNLPG